MGSRWLPLPSNRSHQAQLSARRNSTCSFTYGDPMRMEGESARLPDRINIKPSPPLSFELLRLEPFEPSAGLGRAGPKKQ